LANGWIAISILRSIWVVAYLRWGRTVGEVNLWLLRHHLLLLVRLAAGHLDEILLVHLQLLSDIEGLYSPIVSRHLLLETDLGLVTMRNCAARGDRAVGSLVDDGLGADVPTRKLVLHIRKLILRRVWQASHYATVALVANLKLLAYMKTVLDDGTAIGFLLGDDATTLATTARPLICVVPTLSEILKLALVVT